MLTDEVEIMRNIPIFSKIDPRKLKLLAFTSDRQRFQAGEYLMTEGEMGHCAFVILNGQAEVLITTPQGLLRVASIGRTDLVGEVALLCDVPRTASVRALSPIEALCITKDLFFSLLKEFPDMAFEVMRVLAQRLEKMTTLVREKH